MGCEETHAVMSTENEQKAFALIKMTRKTLNNTKKTTDLTMTYFNVTIIPSSSEATSKSLTG